MVIHRDEDVGLGKIGCHTTLPYRIRNGEIAVETPFLIILPACDRYRLFWTQTPVLHVLPVHEDHPTFIPDAPVPVVQSEYRSIELIMAANGHQHQLITGSPLHHNRARLKKGFFRGRIENSATKWIIQIKS